MEPFSKKNFTAALARRRDEVLAALWQIEARVQERNSRQTTPLNGQAGIPEHEQAALIDHLNHWYRSELAEIDLALERIRQDIYGTCRSCGEPIELAWLEAFPETELCRPCQTAAAGGAIDDRSRPWHRS